MATLNVIYKVAADIAGLESSVSKGVATMGRMESTARELGAALGAAFSVSQIAEMAGHTVEAASRLDDLSKRFGMTAEAVQELDFAAKQNGSTFEAVSAGLAQMSNRLAEGDKSAVGALQALGLSFDAVRAMSPDQAFQAIGDALSNIPDPMERTKLAMDLFGKSGNTLLPVLTSNIGELRDRAREMGLVMSNEVVASGDHLGDTFDQVQTRLDALKAKALMPVLDLFLKMPEPLQTVTGLAYQMMPSLTGIGTAIIAAGGPMAALGMLQGAFATILPFLGPVGILAVAIGAIVLAFKKWDTIKEFVQGVYTAVKTWLVDKFNGIVDSIGKKIDAVTGFFRDMYDKVVGHSYVPDLLRGIEGEFGKLGSVMVDPTDLATRRVRTFFDDMLGDVTKKLTDHFGEGGILGKIIGSGMAMIFGPATGLIVTWAAQGLKKFGELIWDGLKKIGGWFKGLFGFGHHDVPTLDNVINPGATVDFDDSGLPVTGMASGGFGRVSRPTLFLAGEAGPEDFAFSGGGRSFAGGGDVQRQLMDLRMQLARQQQELPKMLRDAVLLAT